MVRSIKVSWTGLTGAIKRTIARYASSLLSGRSVSIADGNGRSDNFHRLGCWLLFARSGSLNFVLRQGRSFEHSAQQRIKLALVYFYIFSHVLILSPKRLIQASPINTRSTNPENGPIAANADRQSKVCTFPRAWIQSRRRTGDLIQTFAASLVHK